MSSEVSHTSRTPSTRTERSRDTLSGRGPRGEWWAVARLQGVASAHQRSGLIRAEPAARVDRLAVGARAEAACVARYDFDVAVPPHLGQVEARPLAPLEKLHGVAPQRLLHDLHHALQLLHADDREPLERLQLGVALRDASRHDHRLPQPLAAANVRLHVLLRWVLDGTCVDQPQVGVLPLRLAYQRVAVLGEKAAHVLGVRVVVAAAISLDVDRLDPGHQ